VRALLIDAGLETALELRRKKIGFVYNTLHGPWGEDGTVQGMLEMMGIPYTGCGVLTSALAMDKDFSKRIFASRGIPTPPWRTLDRASARRYTPPRFPVVVKPSRQGSALGVSVVKAKARYAPALKAAFALDTAALVESFVPGTEITVAILGGKPLPAIEIVPQNEFYDFESKYKPGMSRHIIPRASTRGCWTGRGQPPAPRSRRWAAKRSPGSTSSSTGAGNRGSLR